MSRHHDYIMRFRCPQCKRAGSVKWEETERVAGGEHVPMLKSLSHGFRADAQNKIVCARCTAQVVYGHG